MTIYGARTWTFTYYIVKTIRNRNTGKSPLACSKYSQCYYILLICGGANVSRSRSNAHDGQPALTPQVKLFILSLYLYNIFIDETGHVFTILYLEAKESIQITQF